MWGVEPMEEHEMKQRKWWRYLASKKRILLTVLFFVVVGPIGLSAKNAMISNAEKSVSKYKAMLGHDRVPGEFIIRLDSAKSLAQMSTLFSADLGVQSVKNYPKKNPRFLIVNLADDAKAEMFLQKMNSHPAVRYAEPNYTIHLLGNSVTSPLGGGNPGDDNPDDPPDNPDDDDDDDGAPPPNANGEVIPDDAMFDELWGLRDITQPSADIGAAKAWATERGSKEVLVAVFDTGVDYNHEDLNANIAFNEGEMGLDSDGDEKKTNGIDDDGNGHIDDWRGWNFVGYALGGVGSNDPMDLESHGTHVAGTIGAVGNNGIGTTGVVWHVGIIPVQVLGEDGTGNIFDLIPAIDYAISRGADIINASLGSPGFSQSVRAAIEDASEAGILFVASAGNFHRNNDLKPSYPASYNLDNVIAVAATERTGERAIFSHYGKVSVDIAAPGVSIISTIPTSLGSSPYAPKHGTSMAAPHVAGAAALVWSHLGATATYTKVRDRILNSRTWDKALSSAVASSGRLNVYNAVNAIYPPAGEELEESDWEDGPDILDADGNPTIIETQHPYGYDRDDSWTLTSEVANTKYIRLVFKVDTEAVFDYISILDANGVEKQRISDEYPSGFTSLPVESSSVTIKFKSDSFDSDRGDPKQGSYWGFKLEKYQVITE